MTSTYFHQGLFETDDGAPLWFESRGEPGAVPVVLNDGLGCDGFIWRYLWEPLTAQRRVMHWNYRGHGRSGVPGDDSRIGMEYITDDLARLMDQLRDTFVCVVLHHPLKMQRALELLAHLGGGLFGALEDDLRRREKALVVALVLGVALLAFEGAVTERDLCLLLGVASA